MKKIILRDWLILIILVAPFPFIAFAWGLFPENVPIHFNLHGTPDRYANRATGLFIFPLLNIALYVILQLIPLIDPKRKNYDLFKDRYHAIRIIIHMLLAFVFFLIAVFSLGYSFDLALTLTYALVLMLLFLGNYMSNIRPNYFVGIRTPWTLNNENVWRKTHRFTAKLWVFSSLAMLIVLPFIPAVMIVFIAFVLIIGIIPIVYSYIVFKNPAKTEHELTK